LDSFTINEKHVKKRLDELYSRYNHRRWVPPDPLEFLYGYDDPAEMEIVGLIASSLAYGRVKQIQKSIAFVLDRMPSPKRFIEKSGKKELAAALHGFKHRFTTAHDMVQLFWGVKKALEEHGSLNRCFVYGLCPESDTVLPAIKRFVEKIFPDAPLPGFNLLPHPRRNSALKRLNLYLRWMVRKDGVDPGCWKGVDPGALIVPIDVHMHRVALQMGFTRRKTAGLKCALEVTKAFKRIMPSDPVRYDFCLTRPGILGL